jgi:hypothetical protein
LRAADAPGSSLGLTEDKVDAEGVLQLHLEHLTASWARNDGSAQKTAKTPLCRAVGVHGA